MVWLMCLISQMCPRSSAKRVSECLTPGPALNSSLPDARKTVMRHQMTKCNASETGFKNCSSSSEEVANSRNVTLSCYTGPVSAIF